MLSLFGDLAASPSEGQTEMNRGAIALAALLGLVVNAASRAQDAIPSIPSIPGASSLPGVGSIPSAGAIPGAGAIPDAGALSGAAGALPGAGALPSAGGASSLDALSGAGAGAGAGAVPGASTVAGAAGAAGAQPKTLWSFLGLSKSNLAMCKAKFCSSQLGTLVNNGTKPLSALTGGLIGSCCPPPSAAALAAQSQQGGAEGVAAKIKAEEADAKARIAAIEYLATVDCRYWPEAEGTLVDRLRADRNECVRYAAARALGTGCCCTKKTIAALKLVVECSDSDGNPPERSERVKAAAWYALSHCVGRYVPPPPAPRERPSESPRREFPASYQLGSRAATFEETLAETPDAVLIDDARRLLAATQNAPLGDRTLPTGSRSLFSALKKASGPTSADAETRAKGRRSAVVIRSTAPPYTPAPPVAPIQTVDPSLRRASAEETVLPQSIAATPASAPTPTTRRQPKSLFDLFSASRKVPSGG